LPRIRRILVRAGQAHVIDVDAVIAALRLAA
jgi:hypothetical protein